MKPKLVVIGAAGRMGKRILSLAADSGQFDVVAAVERQDHPDIGKDAGLVVGAGPMNVKLGSAYPAAGDPSTALRACVAVDFSQAVATDKNIDYCIGNSVALVLGTTGLSDEHRQRIRDSSKKIPILYASNMSVGMNVYSRW